MNISGSRPYAHLLTAVILLAGLCAAVHGQQPLARTSLPNGSYLKTCTGAVVTGHNLSANCVMWGGGASMISNLDISGCDGDIWNAVGRLTWYAPRNIWGRGHMIPRDSYLDSCLVQATFVGAPY